MQGQSGAGAPPSREERMQEQEQERALDWPFILGWPLGTATRHAAPRATRATIHTGGGGGAGSGEPGHGRDIAPGA